MQTDNFVELNDFRRQWAEVGQESLAAIQRVGAGGWYILGEEVAQFEEALENYTSVRFAVGCASGLDAIEIGLRALGIERGDKVLTTPLSAFATTLGIIRAGGTPVFIDVNESGLIDLSLAESLLQADRSIRFFVPVHLFGHVLDMEQLRNVKERYDLRVVEDCAQVIGGSHSGTMAGAVGDAAAFSFYPTKNLGALGDGGALITDNAEVAKTCRSLRDYGQTKKFTHSILGMNSRLDEIHAAILSRVLLPRLERWTIRRREIAERYRLGLTSASLKVLPVPTNSNSVWHLFPVCVEAGMREEVITHLRRHRIQTAVHYPKMICDQNALRDVPLEVCGQLTTARQLTEQELSIPIHPYLSDFEVERVMDAVNSWQ